MDVDEYTHCIYFEMNLFMAAPVMAIQGNIEDMAKAKRQDLV